MKKTNYNLNMKYSKLKISKNNENIQIPLLILLNYKIHILMAY